MTVVNQVLILQALQRKERRETGKRRISRIMKVVLGRMKMGSYRVDLSKSQI